MTRVNIRSWARAMLFDLKDGLPAIVDKATGELFMRAVVIVVMVVVATVAAIFVASLASKSKDVSLRTSVNER